MTANENVGNVKEQGGEYVIGVDIGGTFTDCVVTDSRGRITIGKASSTPPDFHRGFIDSIAAAARRLDLTAADLIARAGSIVHGCTVGTNALVEKRTAKVALLTTAGHRDTVFFMQAGNRLAGLDPREIAHLAGQTKPEPLVPKSLVAEITERIATDGRIIVGLDEQAARATVRRLAADGVEAFAITLLWSTANDIHERMLANIVREEAPDAFVSVSSEVVPRQGEYQRAIATLINAMIGPVTSAYLGQLGEQLAGLGYGGALSIMSCTGGLIEAARARTLPLLTIGSGPVAGLIGAGKLARASAGETDLASVNVLTGDMGGTTFDVGIIRGGLPVTRSTTRYGQFEYFVPTLDVRSVGAGGGSIVAYDEQTRSLRVGPRSAGAVPGPAAYLRGGTEATVTDADLVLGYLNPEYFLGGDLALGGKAAHDALERAGRPLGFTAAQTAAAAARIVDDQMADAIRLSSVHQGYDPRSCVMYAYGGAGAVHCPAVARQLGIRTVVMPLGDLAAGWSAFGVGAADAMLVQDAPVSFASPFDAQLLNGAWKQLEEQVWAAVPPAMREAGVTLDRFVEMRYSLQVNELRVPAPGGTYGPAEVASLTASFEQEYERLFGEGSGYAAAGFVITSLRVSARAQITSFELTAAGAGEAYDLQPSSHRDVLWYELGSTPIATPVYSGQNITSGARVTGPAIVEFVDTTLVLRQGQSAIVDAWNSIVIEA
ncbi:N-methylhydantoinase A [Jatrophihabitans sp. GAS493]|uniref:hydantoinase/oxoprolinase family protein n=1 Tax=Jatrophihabitans sp. GAS493 TaxID=1907575 RepID=UPI000BC0A422|nr:hydantoinase/oxoprolinase family protein [Jatrophihabitans sp. GAS493]SOD72141.1 N-methylhydantoinase A [Jatrophihabitans sp. GAS493]